MPIYQYRCENLHIVEKTVKLGEDSKVFDCETCAKPMKRVYNTFGIRLKGSGFYRRSAD